MVLSLSGAVSIVMETTTFPVHGLTTLLSAIRGPESRALS